MTFHYSLRKMLTTDIVKSCACRRFYAGFSKAAERTGQEKAKVKTSVKAGPFTPAITKYERLEMERTISLRVSAGSLTWVALDSSLTVSAWDEVAFDNRDDESNYTPYEHHTYIDKITESIRTVPTSDVFLLEQRAVRVRHMAIVPELVTQFAIEAMVVGLLTALHPKTPLVSMRTSVVDSCFELKIGNERVSAQPVAEQLMAGGSQTLNATVGQVTSEMDWLRVSVSKDFQEHYFGKKSIARENMALALLQPVAFYQFKL